MTGSVPQQLRRWLPRPYLLRIGRFPVSSYMAALYIGFVTGLFAALPAARERGVDELRFVSAAVTLLVPALAGGRTWLSRVPSWPCSSTDASGTAVRTT